MRDITTIPNWAVWILVVPIALICFVFPPLVESDVASPELDNDILREGTFLLAGEGQCRLERARELGEWYSPEHYALDLLELLEHRKEWGIPLGHGDGYQIEMFELVRENVRAGLYTDAELSMALGDVQDRVDSPSTRLGSPEFQAKFRRGALYLYLGGIPFGFVIFLLRFKWHGEDRPWNAGVDEATHWRLTQKTLKENPVTFMGWLLLYPFVIWWWIRESGVKKQLTTAAEIRRYRIGLFEPFGKSEYALLREFLRRGLSQDQVRVELEAMGHAPRYSYNLALLATVGSLLLGTLGSTAYAASPSEIKECLTVSAPNRAGPSLESASSGEDGPPAVDLPDQPGISPPAPTGLVLVRCERVVNRPGKPPDTIPIASAA